ncbi:MAG: sugar porter family MFS transporter [Gammaproteobacteria bacterium]|uniref:sugar porter family MFS transporter n=1 Tax=Pseudomaricurvus alcaniphilus TaxID=1166482 RepID=UPI00140D3629|nr:sugar porter family MFS transporter [Pseudomaricurvus alcaniphilus]MBR9911181.1 sugar porter family MFS transporter [Gammaproteobacteria bacterium]NHN36339.1 sugar porter family MFS transporter [Pseudomaricurvus alcaniphilus]
MNKIVYWSLTVSVAGFLFGFDTAVISGADKPIQELWQTSPLFHGAFIMSSALWGTVIGALAGSIPCDALGRKITLIGVGVLYLVSALGSAIAPDPYTFSFFRFIGGLGVGASSIAVPAYISEIAPAKIRGRLVATYQFQIVFGILIAFLSNYLVAEWVGLNWRVMLGIEVVPAAIFLLMVTGVPESPRWLIRRKNDVEGGRAVLQQIGEAVGESENVDKLVARIEADAQQHQKDHLYNKVYAFPILLAFLIAAFNQLSGINFIIYFAPRVFELAGLDASSALLSSAGIGLTNLAFTMLGLYLIDNVGRKTLMLIGSIGYIVSLSVVAWAFYSGAGGMLVVLFVFVFIASHAVGQGAVIWVFIAEIFPNSVRATGQSLGAGTHWVFAAVITLVMPFFLSRFEPTAIFIFFAAMMVLQLLYVLFMMPETKGRSLEDLGKDVYEHHLV